MDALFWSIGQNLYFYVTFDESVSSGNDSGKYFVKIDKYVWQKCVCTMRHNVRMHNKKDIAG